MLDLTLILSGPTCMRQLADRYPNVISLDILMEKAAGRPVRHGLGFRNLHCNKFTANALENLRRWHSKKLVRPMWCERARYAIDGSEHPQKDQLLAAK